MRSCLSFCGSGCGGFIAAAVPTIVTISQALKVFGPFNSAPSGTDTCTMCDYCGCQALDAIAELTAEHDAVVNICGQLLRALKAGHLDAAAQKARAIEAVLASHTAVEEEALFPAMNEAYGEHVTALRQDHRLIESVLAESSDGTPTDPGWSDRLEHALWVLREHILREEHGVFPAALAELSPEQWDTLDDVRARVGSGIRAQA